MDRLFVAAAVHRPFGRAEGKLVFGRTSTGRIAVASEETDVELRRIVEASGLHLYEVMGSDLVLHRGNFQAAAEMEASERIELSRQTLGDISDSMAAMSSVVVWTEYTVRVCRRVLTDQPNKNELLANAEKLAPFPYIEDVEAGLEVTWSRTGGGVEERK